MYIGLRVPVRLADFKQIRLFLTNFPKKHSKIGFTGYPLVGAWLFDMGWRTDGWIYGYEGANTRFSIFVRKSLKMKD